MDNLRRQLAKVTAERDALWKAVCSESDTELRDHNDRIQYAKELRNRYRWVSVDERLPECGVYVLAAGKNSLGKWRRVRALYAEKFSIEQPIDSEYESDYDEETDNYYWPEGWYECVDFWDEMTGCRIDEGFVLKWMPLPPAEGE